VSAFVRDPARLAISSDRLSVVAGDMRDATGVAAACVGRTMQ